MCPKKGVPTGRPPTNKKLTPDVLEKINTLIILGVPITLISKRFGISRVTIYRWRKASGRQPEYLLDKVVPLLYNVIKKDDDDK